MKKITVILLTILVSLTAAASASAHERYYVPKPHAKCRAGYRRETVRVRRREHHRSVRVRQVRCVYKTTVKKPVATPVGSPTSTPVTAPTSTPTVARASIDPSYTQDPSDPLKVTWAYSASGDGTPLPDGTLALTVAEPNAAGPSGGCVMNVDAATTGGTCTVELPAYGAWQVTVTYTGSGSVVAPATSTDTETIEPPAATIARSWGSDAPTSSPAIAATVIGSSASVTVTDQSFEGASTVSLSDQLGDSCSATVSGTEAACQMSVTGTPTRFLITYPGGASTQSTQPVAPDGTQQVTTTWPTDTVAVTSPAVTVQDAQVEECGGDQQGGPLWGPSGTTFGCGPNPPQQYGSGGPEVVSGQWPNPVTIGTGEYVEFDAAAVGTLSSDETPAGYLTFNLSGPDAPSFASDEDYGATPPGGNVSAASQDCSQVENAAWPQQAVGGCDYEFSTPGTYTLTVSFTSQDANYADSQQAYTETIDVQ